MGCSRVLRGDLLSSQRQGTKQGHLMNNTSSSDFLSLSLPPPHQFSLPSFYLSLFHLLCFRCLTVSRKSVF